MKLSQKTLDKLYEAIHASLIDLRIELKLPAQQDFKVAQVEHKIWQKQKQALEINHENE